LFFTDQYINDAMINTLKNFNKKKLAGLILILVIIIAFGFGGFGGGFSTNNQNNMAKINKTNVTTQDFMNYLNDTGISQKSIQENLDNNIIGELLSGLISTKLLNLEIEDFDISVTKLAILKKIKKDKNFLDENKVFQRTKYEKFLLSNNMTAPKFELELKNRELQKYLFDFIGAGTITPDFLVQKNFEDEYKILNLEYFDMEKLYKNKEDYTDFEIKNFVEENKDQLKIEYIDFKYAVLNPKNLIGLDEFNQEFFNEIDKIENKISEGKSFESILEKFNINIENVKEYTSSSVKKINEDIIYSNRSSKLDIIENENDFLLFSIENKYYRNPDLSNDTTKNEMAELLHRKGKFDLNKSIFDQIQKKEFDNNKFAEMAVDGIKYMSLNSINDNEKLDINSVKMLYSLPINSFTFVNDNNNKIYLVKIINSEKNTYNKFDKNYLDFVKSQNTNNRRSILQSYDHLLNNKYKVKLNQKAIDRVSNYFK